MFTGLLQPTHLIILLVVALVFLGPKRLPEAGRALGQGIKEFKHSIGREQDEDPRPAVQSTVTTQDNAPAP